MLLKAYLIVSCSLLYTVVNLCRTSTFHSWTIQCNKMTSCFSLETRHYEVQVLLNNDNAKSMINPLILPKVLVFFSIKLILKKSVYITSRNFEKNYT